MAKLLFLSAQYPPEAKGGGELSTHIIAQGLQKLGHAVRVITSGTKENESQVDGISVLTLPLHLRKKPLFERTHSKNAARIFRTYLPDLSSYDIVHAHDFRSALMLSECSVKNAVVTARDYAQIAGCTNNIQRDGNIDPGCQGANELFKCHRVAEASIARKPFRIWQYRYNLPYRKSAFQSFKHQIFISHAQQELIAKYQNISHQHSTVIYNPISQEYLSEPLRKGEVGNVLYLGRVEMYKGVLVLLKAWRGIIKTNQRAHLTIAGDGAQREEYERLASTWGLQYRVTFISHVPYHRLRAMINDAEILVAPHLWVEPFGRTVIEGMSRGKIVIASNVGGPAEIIKHKKTGLLFERGSVQGLQSELSHALDMNHFDKKEIGIAARDYVRDHLNMETIAKEHENFYNEVLGKK
jgi:glycosyltransferase involved in cell wall biosynthesis